MQERVEKQGVLPLTWFLKLLVGIERVLRDKEEFHRDGKTDSEEEFSMFFVLQKGKKESPILLILRLDW